SKTGPNFVPDKFGISYVPVGQMFSSRLQGRINAESQDRLCISLRQAMRNIRSRKPGKRLMCNFRLKTMVWRKNKGSGMLPLGSED
ncbi:hypothetical protein, partial [Shewanella algae]|uniref:hypothetical protein n=1 Tax=Shewanella algae TaxID=38313 RepID=UPI001C92B07A